MLEIYYYCQNTGDFVATEQSTANFIVDQLASLDGVSARKMFGEYALYFDGKVVGLICDNTLFIKITDTGKSFIGKYYKEGFAYPKAKPSMVIDEERIEDRQWLCDLIELTSANLPTPKPKKRKL